MSSFQFVKPMIGVLGVSATGTSQFHPLGLQAEAVDGSLGYAKFMYVRGASASSLAAGEVGVLTGFSAGQIASANTASQGVVGIAPAALSATNVFGWVQIEGLCDYAKLASAGTGAVGAPIFIGSTAGRAATTASAAGFLLERLFVNNYAATSNSNSATVQLMGPAFNGR